PPQDDLSNHAARGSSRYGTSPADAHTVGLPSSRRIFSSKQFCFHPLIRLAHTFAFATSGRRFAVTGTNRDRRPPPLEPTTSFKSNELQPIFSTADHRLSARLLMVDTPIRLESNIGASSKIGAPSSDSAEFPPLCIQRPIDSTHPESTQPLDPVVLKTKTFVEALSSPPTNKNLQPKPTDLRKFFLADDPPQSLGAKENINGKPTLVFSEMETEELAAAFRFAL
ncbi:hypothetical protein Salat_1368900, partial [Sesamum alatum]